MENSSENISPVILHVLPGETGGDTSWFFRQNHFEQQEILRQVAFKNKYWPGLGNGKFAKRPQHTYPHILPDGNVRKAYYEPIADKVLQYLEEENIALHTEALNLKSSQVACFNFLFPIRRDPQLATRLLKPHFSGMDSVTGIEFEYTGPIEATKWLGEPLGGKRGQNRTSIDAAIFWKDENRRRHASLIEWKYTEHNFGVCSAFSNGNKEEKAICKSLNVAEDSNPAHICLLTSGKRHRSRRYWEHMESAGISLDVFSDVPGCPFQGPFYQLMRQYLLGSYLQVHNIVDRFEVVSLDFSGNNQLYKIPGHLRPMVNEEDYDVVFLWNTALPDGNKMRHITVEDLMVSADGVDGIDSEWRAYIQERYGVQAS